MSKFVIRKATENDAESLLKIYEPYITNTTITFEYDVPTAEAFADRIRETAAAFPYLVCECDGVIMGYAYAHRIRERAAYDWDAELSIYLAQGTHGPARAAGAAPPVQLRDPAERKEHPHAAQTGLCGRRRVARLRLEV